VHVKIVLIFFLCVVVRKFDEYAYALLSLSQVSSFFRFLGSIDSNFLQYSLCAIFYNVWMRMRCYCCVLPELVLKWLWSLLWCTERNW